MIAEVNARILEYLTRGESMRFSRFCASLTFERNSALLWSIAQLDSLSPQTKFRDRFNQTRNQRLPNVEQKLIATLIFWQSKKSVNCFRPNHNPSVLEESKTWAHGSIQDGFLARCRHGPIERRRTKGREPERDLWNPTSSIEMRADTKTIDWTKDFKERRADGSLGFLRAGAGWGCWYVATSRPGRKIGIRAAPVRPAWYDWKSVQELVGSVSKPVCQHSLKRAKIKPIRPALRLRLNWTSIDCVMWSHIATNKHYHKNTNTHRDHQVLLQEDRASIVLWIPTLLYMI